LDSTSHQQHLPDAAESCSLLQRVAQESEGAGCSSAVPGLPVPPGERRGWSSPAKHHCWALWLCPEQTKPQILLRILPRVLSLWVTVGLLPLLACSWFQWTQSKPRPGCVWIRNTRLASARRLTCCSLVPLYRVEKL